MVNIKAYAKINLNLKILDKLANGYHKISSIFQAVDIYDNISISKKQKGFCLTGSIVCPIEDNIITKSKKTLESFVEKELPCNIHLIKNIPLCAGLGGGSSDAAAMLIGLNNIYSLNLSLKHLIEIGLKIGSDVPFFVSNKGTALVEGTGEKINQVKNKPSKFYILARPHKRVSTAKMYSMFDEKGKSFLELAQEICPVIEEIYSYFDPIANECGMSGSGPTMFAGFNSYDKALKSIKGFGIEKFNGDFFICRPSKNTYNFF